MFGDFFTVLYLIVYIHKVVSQCHFLHIHEELIFDLLQRYIPSEIDVISSPPKGRSGVGTQSFLIFMNIFKII